MAVLRITINETERVIDTDELTIGFFEDLERMQDTKRMGDFVPVLAGLLNVERADARSITMRQWREIASAIRAASQADPT